MNRPAASTIGGGTSLGWLRAKRTLRNMAGWCLEKCKAPARLKAFEYVDPASDETVYLYTSKRYSVLCVGERRFYFDRVSGEFDGMSAPPSLIPEWAEFGD
jgi:hypothetical protein